MYGETARAFNFALKISDYTKKPPKTATFWKLNSLINAIELFDA